MSGPSSSTSRSTSSGSVIGTAGVGVGSGTTSMICVLPLSFIFGLSSSSAAETPEVGTSGKTIIAKTNATIATLKTRGTAFVWER